MADEPLVLDGPIQEAFGLSYASYLVIPRTILQSMTIEWQERFVAIVDEVHERFPGWEPEPPAWYQVRVRDGHGRFLHDPLADYERGMRRLEPVPYRTEPGPCEGCRLASGPHHHLPSGRVCAPPLTDCPFVGCTLPPGHTHESDGPACAQTEDPRHG